MENIRPKAVHHIEVTTVIDNYVDLLLESTKVVQRPPLTKTNMLPEETFNAEHGLSLLVKTFSEDTQHSILLDTGYNIHNVIYNMRLLDIQVSSIETIVISHAHMDHAGSLYPLVEKMTKPVSVVVHPDVFVHPRILKTPDGRRLDFPQCYDRERMEKAGIHIIESKDATSVADDTIVVTGQVKRTTDFEKSMPNAFYLKADQWQPDPIADDQSLLLHLEGKGLVLITGCCHSGIINTVRYAQKLTGIKDVYAIVGGFHLTGPASAPIVAKTVEVLRQIDPKVIIPMHCTGWHSTQKIAAALTDAFILNSVGSTYTFKSV
jgi:7,8-dihydropterin-6-yl-methyl-4-(beta-D-ribofuranosyl)aminobenzene 5'-phosphate synthase